MLNFIKKSFKLFLFLSFILLVGLSFTGCEGGLSDNSGSEENEAAIEDTSPAYNAEILIEGVANEEHADFFSVSADGESGVDQFSYEDHKLTGTITGLSETTQLTLVIDSNGLAEGEYTVDNEVIEVSSDNNEAKFGVEYYEKVNSAEELERALGKEDISAIILGEDITLDSNQHYTINRNLIIELDGNVLTLNVDIEITEGNTLTIKSDNADALAGEGEIIGEGYFNDMVNFAGGDGSAERPYKIENWHHLDNVSNYLADHFELAKNLDNGSKGYNELIADPTEGWDPIGDSFTGTFDGSDYIISDLKMDISHGDYIGLFAENFGVITNLGIKDAKITGDMILGIGSLVGSNGGVIKDSYATGDVIGARDLGGLVGYNGGVIKDSYATGDVKGWAIYVGGLVGVNRGDIEGSYATGDVTGGDDVGGLVGGNRGDIEGSYATGDVTGGDDVGGLVGCNFILIQDSYATGKVTGDYNVGGLIGYNKGSIQNIYWDTDTSGMTSSAGGTGKPSYVMNQKATFEGWDFDNIWDIEEGETYPWLRWQGEAGEHNENVAEDPNA